MHHTDLDYDVSTGVRFHPLSIFISALIKLSLILALGPTAVAVVIAELMLNLTPMFNHSNIRIPDSLDRMLRVSIVTPDMHRIHHSTDRTEHNRNFGFIEITGPRTERTLTITLYDTAGEELWNFQIDAQYYRRN